VQVGEDINIPNFQIDPSTGRATVTGFQTRSTGVILKVTPHVNPEEEIVLDLAPEITEVGSTFDTFAQGISFPRFTVQKAQTQVRLNNGQTLVIGGLVKRKTVITKNKVPILGDIPVIGLAFSHKREQTDPHQDLLIFLTVRLVEDAVPPRTGVAAQPASP
jgi:type II secretory pathway component GspD/PulD (secretin)